MSRQAVINEAKMHLDGPLPVRIVCPACNGGSSHEECLVIWDGGDGNVYATCHRAHCDINTVLVAGSLRVLTASAGSMTPKPEHLKRTKQWGQGQRLSDAGREFVERKYRYPFFTADSEFLKSYNIGTKRECLYLPMSNADGEQRGCILKPIHKDSGLPKSLTYKDDDYDGMSWYLTSWHMAEPSIVLVEDPLSALALLSEGTSAISLNGTLLNIDRLESISAHKRKIHIWLDADATNKAVKYAIKFGNRYSLKVHRLTTDPKDMTIDELQFVLRRADLLNTRTQLRT